VGIALSGYDMPAQLNVQWTVQMSYDSVANVFMMLVLPYNGTSFYFLNYYLMIVSTSASQYIQVQS
jgi:hypothetical protein